MFVERFQGAQDNAGASSGRQSVQPSLAPTEQQTQEQG